MKHLTAALAALILSATVSAQECTETRLVPPVVKKASPVVKKVASGQRTRVSKPRRAKRRKATPAAPRFETVPVACPSRPPVVELFLPEKLQPKQSRPEPKGLFPAPVFRPMPQPWEGPAWNTGPTRGEHLVPPTYETPKPGSIPIPGTLLLLAGGLVAIWRVRR